jgi:hypothetical protein
MKMKTKIVDKPRKRILFNPVFSTRPKNHIICPCCDSEQGREHDICYCCKTTFYFLDETNKFALGS